MKSVLALTSFFTFSRSPTKQIKFQGEEEKLCGDLADDSFA